MPPQSEDEETGPAPPAPPAGRLHPAAMVLWPLGQVGPLVFLVIAGRLQTLVGVLVLVGLVTTSVLRWVRFTWRIERGALVVEQGVFQRRRRVIPLDRVQSVDVVRNLRHRLFGVVELRVEAVGGQDTEGRLDALAPADANQLRAYLLDRRGPTESRDAAEVARPAVLTSVAPRELVIAGLTGSRVGVMAALIGFALELLGERVDELISRAPAVLGIRGLVALVIVGLLLALVLSVAATVLAYWDFTVTRHDDRLQVRRGLLQQRLETVPLRRIQAVRVEENLVRRALRLAAVKVDVAGRHGGDDARQTGLLLPLGSRGEAFALAAQVLALSGHEVTGYEGPSAPLTAMPPAARDRRIGRVLVPLTILVVAAVWWRGSVWLSLAALAVPGLVLALVAYRALGFGRTGSLVIGRAGLLVRRTVYVPQDRLQSLALRANPFQRSRGLATLHLQIARSPGVWGGPQLIDMSAVEGARLQRLLAGTMHAAHRPDRPGPGVGGGAAGGGARRRPPPHGWS